MLLTAILGFIVLSVIGGFQAKLIAKHYVELVVQNKVEKLRYITSNNLEKWKSQINMLANIQGFEKMDYDKLKEYICVNQQDFMEYENIFIADKKGYYKGTNNKQGSILDREYFHKVMTGKSVVSQPMISKTTGDPIIIIAAPVRDQSDYSIIGLVAGAVKLSKITDIINAEVLGDNGYAYMIDSSGMVMAHPRKEFILKRNFLKEPSFSRVKIIKKMAQGEKGIGEYEFEGENKIIAYTPIADMGWSIGMTAYDHEITKDVYILRNYILLIGFTIVGVIGVLLYFIVDTLIHPINKLKNYMEIATKGNLMVYSDIQREDEIGVLSDRFNTLMQENNRLLEEMRQQDQYRTEFFSNISHELKTPLNRIFSTMQLMELYSIDEKQDEDTGRFKKYIYFIKQNSYRLLRLVNNLIDITRIDSGYIKLNLENANLVEVIENITMSTVEYVHNKGRSIIFDTEIEEKIMAFDVEQIERVILNLISNAVKFTSPGDLIEINIYDRGERVEISVKDNGIGIPSHKQGLIFERFKQATALYNREKEGSGIGLSLVKELIEMHEGSISVQSKVGEGSEFIIQLPAVVCKEDKVLNSFVSESKIEKIKIEFSDIYE